MVMKYKLGDIVKFLDRQEPCTVYRIIDRAEVLIEFQKEGMLPHVKIEVLGFVPVKYIEPAGNIVGNKFAIDAAMEIHDHVN